MHALVAGMNATNKAQWSKYYRAYRLLTNCDCGDTYSHCEYCSGFNALREETEEYYDSSTWVNRGRYCDTLVFRAETETGTVKIGSFYQNTDFNI